MPRLSFTLNGASARAEARDCDTLLDLLREGLGMTGTKEGCGKGECGACTVLVDDRPVNACLFPAPEVEGLAVRTIEGLADGGLSPVQQAFVDQGGIQCGFCSPGMILSATALLERNPDPDDAAIRTALAGNLCRCTGYAQIVASVQAAASALQGGTP